MKAGMAHQPLPYTLSSAEGSEHCPLPVCGEHPSSPLQREDLCAADSCLLPSTFQGSGLEWSVWGWEVLEHDTAESLLALREKLHIWYNRPYILQSPQSAPASLASSHSLSNHTPDFLSRLLPSPAFTSDALGTCP